MKSLYRIIKEEYIRFLKESYDEDDVDYDFFERDNLNCRDYIMLKYPKTN